MKIRIRFFTKGNSEKKRNFAEISFETKILLKFRYKSEFFRNFCDICSFQSRLITGLKTHYTRIHGKKYSLKENVSSDNHGKICVSKTQKLDSDCVRCKDCGLAFVDDKSLADHKGSVHTKSLKRCTDL